MIATSSVCQNLIIVAGHAPFKEAVDSVPEHSEKDDAWVLQPFQRGEPAFYIEHIRRGCALLAEDSNALLVFSGGYTRQEAGLRWSEAATYAATARHFKWWRSDASDEARRDLESRVATEDFSRDSFENLLFGLCRFQQVVGHYPQIVTVVSWAFKRARFDLHRAAIRFPAACFRFEGPNEPINLEAALKGETLTVREFTENKYGNSRGVAKKRAGRNPFNRQHNFASCPGMKHFFNFIEGSEKGNFAGRLPWEN
jgi:hypothetical protein